MEWQTEELARLARLGFAHNRVTTTMSLDLNAAKPSAPEVEGVELRTWDDAALEGARLAHNAAFIDHYGSSPSGPRNWRGRTVENANFRPDLSGTAIADGRTVGYLLAHRYPQDDEVLGRSEVWISTLGVVPEWRGRGVASALLARTLRLAAGESELTHAALGVDSQSPTEANRLYERLGFRPLSQWITMAPPVERDETRRSDG